ncbi:MAG: peptidylprolyl isomerase [Bacteroidetes bacterium]|nr:MAG: peptidylprolyl isomerase [Bacteroidota bacterium]
MSFRNLLLLAILSLTILACNKTDQAEVDRNAILQYLQENNLTATEHDSGVFYIIDTPGSGGSPDLNSTITVRYKGSYLDDVVFGQTSGSETAQLKMNELIQGWQIALPYFQKGSTGTIFIPSGLGYGGNPPVGIRANAVLKFDIELVDFQ